MQKLKSIEHVHLNGLVLKNLVQNKITTVLEFLHEDPEKLSTITKLTFSQILEIRNDIFKKHSAVLIKGETLLEKISLYKKLSTGIRSLDEILNGGIPIGITELYGLAESGKTQLCFQLAINSSINTENKVLYIDTKGDFSAIRIQKILESNGYSHKDMAMILYKIKVIHIWTIEELIELLKMIKNKLFIIDKLSMIIIDSIPCLMFQHLGDSNKIGLTYLNTVVNYSRYLYRELNLAIICVNIETRWIDQDITEVEDDAEHTVYRESGYIEKHNRCLGQYWRNVPSTVLMLEKSQIFTEDNSHKLIVHLSKFQNLECARNCILNLNNLRIS